MPSDRRGKRITKRGQIFANADGGVYQITILGKKYWGWKCLKASIRHDDIVGKGGKLAISDIPPILEDGYAWLLTEEEAVLELI